MAVSLYDLSVTNYLQTLGAVEGFVAKSLSHFNDNKVDANEVADVRLALESDHVLEAGAGRDRDRRVGLAAYLSLTYLMNSRTRT